MISDGPLYASASAIIRMVRQAMEEHPESLLHAVAREQGKIGAINLFLARDRGDAAACELFDRYVKYLSIGVGNLIAILLLGKYAVRCFEDYRRQRREGKDPVYHASSIPEIADDTECWQ